MTLKNIFTLLLITGLWACAEKQPKEAGAKKDNLSLENQQNTYEPHWQIKDAQHIFWDLKKDHNLPHTDNIEMAGKRVAGIVTYAIDADKNLSLERYIFFPQLITHIKVNDPGWQIYRAYLKETYDDNILPRLLVGDKVFSPGPVEAVHIDGILTFQHAPAAGLQLTRKLFPSMSERLFVEQWTLTNKSDQPVTIYSGNTFIEQEDYGQKGKYTRTVKSDASSEIRIAAEESYTFSITIGARLDNEPDPAATVAKTLEQRQDFLNDMAGSLTLETPNPVLNTLFEFSKIRASENIFESKLGLVHSPGGGRYYIGFWANDQAEYVGPFFPYLGYQTANDASLNMYRLYAREMNDAYKNIRYSFEMEGDAPINPLDRGDAAMIAYGTAQFAMAVGDRAIAEELWPLIAWCLEYCRRKTNAEGVVESQSDEMEGRIETGTANLSTSALTYGALNLSVDLGKSLNKPDDLLAGYRQRASDLNNAIERYFGATVEGLETYRYYKGHQNLRHWICLPLVMGINDRVEGTIEALFDRLWSPNGVHVEKNADNEAISKIFWDRGTLYALRGTFLAGATEQSLEKLTLFSAERLLGARVPYVVEAYPEGNMAHLSAESGLYCRVFTEGMFGIVPTGLNSFKCTPRLPDEWDHMALKNIRAFGQNFNVKVSRTANELLVSVTGQDQQPLFETKTNPGETLHITFP